MKADLERVGRPGFQWSAPRKEEPNRGAAMPRGFVYFIRCGISGPTKIGWAMNPERRMGELQIGSASRLHPVGFWPGTVADERALHKQLADYRRRGDWFVLPKDLMSQIREQAGGFMREQLRDKIRKET